MNITVFISGGDFYTGVYFDVIAVCSMPGSTLLCFGNAAYGIVIGQGKGRQRK